MKTSRVQPAFAARTILTGLATVVTVVTLATPCVAHAEKRKVRAAQKSLSASPAADSASKLQPFGTCRESEYYTKPLARKYHFLELLSDGKGGIVLRDRQAEPQELKGGQNPTSTDPSTYSDKSYTYSAAGSNWADDLPMPLAMFGRECSAQYSSSSKDFFEVTKLTHPTSGAVQMPGAADDGKVDYALTTVQDHTHVRINFTCRLDVMNNPLRCEKPAAGGGVARRQHRRDAKQLPDPAPLDSVENIDGPAGNSKARDAR